MNEVSACRPRARVKQKSIGKTKHPLQPKLPDVRAPTRHRGCPFRHACRGLAQRPSSSFACPCRAAGKPSHPHAAGAWERGCGENEARLALTTQPRARRPKQCKIGRTCVASTTWPLYVLNRACTHVVDCLPVGGRILNRSDISRDTSAVLKSHDGNWLRNMRLAISRLSLQRVHQGDETHI